MTYSRSSIANIETGLQHVSRAFWEKIEVLLGTAGELLRGYHSAEALQRAHHHHSAGAQALSNAHTYATRSVVACPDERHAPELHGAFVASADSEPPTASDDPVIVSVVIEGETRTMRISRRALLQAAQGATAAMALPNAGLGSALPDAVRAAVLVTDLFEGTGSAARLPQVQQQVSRVHLAYQRADYDEAAASVPALMHAISRLSNDVGHDGRQHIATTIAFAHLAVSKLALKFGDAQLAWLAADRAQSWAAQTRIAALNQVVLVAIGSALLALPDRGHDAAALAERALRTTTRQGRDPAGISAIGALHLLAAGVATRFDDHSSARQHLNAAGAMADSLGGDRNEMWTAFGPTNVLIHQVSLAAKIEPEQAIALGERLDTTRLQPALASRRSQVHLDLATAFAHRPDRDPSAVLHLLQVEKLAPQLLMIHPPTRSLIHRLLTRERTAATPGLRALASRVGLAA